MKAKTSIKRSDIKVRKILPTHLVAQRVFKSKKNYKRKNKFNSSHDVHST